MLSHNQPFLPPSIHLFSFLLHFEALLLLPSRLSRVRICDPIDGSPPGSAVPGILQARTRVGCHFLLQCMKVKSDVWLFATPWTAAYQAALSMGFSRQEYWSGLPLPSPDFGVQLQAVHAPKHLHVRIINYPFWSVSKICIQWNGETSRLPLK